MKFGMSICLFNDNSFEITFRDKETFKEIIFTGDKKCNREEIEFANRIAPACVYTYYTEDE